MRQKDVFSGAKSNSKTKHQKQLDFCSAKILHVLCALALLGSLASISFITWAAFSKTSEKSIEKMMQSLDVPVQDAAPQDALENRRLKVPAFVSSQDKINADNKKMPSEALKTIQIKQDIKNLNLVGRSTNKSVEHNKTVRSKKAGMDRKISSIGGFKLSPKCLKLARTIPNLYRSSSQGAYIPRWNVTKPIELYVHTSIKPKFYADVKQAVSIWNSVLEAEKLKVVEWSYRGDIGVGNEVLNDYINVISKSYSYNRAKDSLAYARLRYGYAQGLSEVDIVFNARHYNWMTTPEYQKKYPDRKVASSNPIKQHDAVWLTQMGAAPLTPFVGLVPNYAQNDQLFRPILVHELGHLLGLEHSSNGGSIMHRTSDAVGLSVQDIQHLKCLYPNKKSSSRNTHTPDKDGRLGSGFVTLSGNDDSQSIQHPTQAAGAVVTQPSPTSSSGSGSDGRLVVKPSGDVQVATPKNSQHQGGVVSQAVPIYPIAPDLMPPYKELPTLIGATGEADVSQRAGLQKPQSRRPRIGLSVALSGGLSLYPSRKDVKGRYILGAAIENDFSNPFGVGLSYHYLPLQFHPNSIRQNIWQHNFGLNLRLNPLYEKIIRPYIGLTGGYTLRQYKNLECKKSHLLDSSLKVGDPNILGVSYLQSRSPKSGCRASSNVNNKKPTATPAFNYGGLAGIELDLYKKRIALGLEYRYVKTTRSTDKLTDLFSDRSSASRSARDRDQLKNSNGYEFENSAHSLIQVFLKMGF